MKLIPLFLALVLSGTAIYAQSTPVPRFSKHRIGSSAVSAYFPEATPAFDESYSEDSSVVITYESLVNEHTFGLIHVDFRSKISDSLDRENLLMTYMDFLQESFAVSASAGYGKGHKLESNPKAQGIIDFWQDLDDTEYSVKGWITENNLTVLMIYGKSEYPSYNVVDMFFNGVRY